MPLRFLSSCRLTSALRVASLILQALAALWSDVHGQELNAVLSSPVLPAGTALRQVQAYCDRRVPRMPEVASAEEWNRKKQELRERALNEVVLRGEAADWAKQPTKVEWLDTIEGGPEYRIRKLRYEAVPGLWIPALLYEPKKLEGKVPVFLNVNGHDGNGMVADYKQTRCINQAKQGILSLNAEWVGMGQLRGDDFVHYRLNQMDLCGTSGIAVHYLAQKRALDILLDHEHADPARVGVAGLSGGGWQTIFIAGLDDRITLANPVAGYSSFRTRAYFPSDLGDSEQTPCDLATVVDYAHLTAMRAPHPLLLTNNDRDQCCFAAGHALPPLLEAARPIYRLYDAGDQLWAHINHVPGSHNFLADNREALNRLIAAHWFEGQSFSTGDIDCSAELKTAKELAVPLPEKNPGFNTLALQLADRLKKEPAETLSREELAKVVRSRDLAVTNVTTTERPGGRGLLFQLGEEWQVPAVEIGPADAARTVVVLCDGGRRNAATFIQPLLDSGARVIAVDPFYFGESAVSQRDFLYALLVSAVGERPLGIQADQVRAISRHLKSTAPQTTVEVSAIGGRTSLIALVAAALEPEAISALELRGAPESLHNILTEDLQVTAVPEQFCFGLLKAGDIPQIEALVASRAIRKQPLASQPTPR